MPRNRNITAADASIIMTVDELYPQGVTLEQFSTDAAVAASDDTVAETRMGVDLQMVAGYVDSIKTVTITLEPSSPSIEYFDNLIKASRMNKTCYWITLNITLPALNKCITFSNGVLKTGKLLPDVRNVLDPVTYTIDFEKVA